MLINNYTTYIFTFLLAVLLTSTSTVYAVVIDDDATIIYLRKACQEGGIDQNNCFTDLGSVQDWVNNTRTPSPDHPQLLIDIGPGLFRPSGDTVFACRNMSNITLRGSGRDQTILGGSVTVNIPGFGDYVVPPQILESARLTANSLQLKT